MRPARAVPSVLLPGTNNASRLGKRAKEMRKSASPVSPKGDLTDNAIPARQGALKLQEVVIAVPGDVPGLTAVVYHRFDPGCQIGALNFGSGPGSTGATEAVVKRRGFRRG